MLSSGVESLLDSSVSAAIEELYTGLPESISRDLMAVPGPSLGLDAQSDGPVPVLAHRDGPWTSAIGNFCHKTQDLGDVLQVISHGPAESFPEELLQAGDIAEDEKRRKRHFRKLDCSGDGYQKEDEEAQGAEDHHAECYPLTLGESWSEQVSECRNMMHDNLNLGLESLGSGFGNGFPGSFFVSSSTES